MSYAVPPSFRGGLAFNLERPYFGGPNLLKGFPNHPSLWRGLPLVMIQSATQSKCKKRPPPTPACISKHW